MDNLNEILAAFVKAVVMVICGFFLVKIVAYLLGKTIGKIDISKKLEAFEKTVPAQKAYINKCMTSVKKIKDGYFPKKEETVQK